MTQSTPRRSRSLCHRYVSSAPSTSRTTCPQSRSDHVPGNTWTPNLMGLIPRLGRLAWRDVPLLNGRPLGWTLPAFSWAAVRRVQLEAVVLDHLVREEPPAHLVHPQARRLH